MPAFSSCLLCGSEYQSGFALLYAETQARRIFILTVKQHYVTVASTTNEVLVIREKEDHDEMDISKSKFAMTSGNICQTNHVAAAEQHEP
jgi:hypothetical protein